MEHVSSEMRSRVARVMPRVDMTLSFMGRGFNGYKVPSVEVTNLLRDAWTIHTKKARAVWLGLLR